MRKIKPVDIREMDFTPYGRWYELRKDKEGYCPENGAALKRPYKLGVTKAGAGSFECLCMERHVSTEEVLLASDAPLILVVADSSPYGAPQAEDLAAVRIEPGQAVVLKQGVWHEACRCAEGKNSAYYFLAHNNGDPSELVWTEVFPEGVHVQIKNCPQVPLQEETGPRESERRLPFGVLHDVLADGRVAGRLWECWQTENVCIPARLTLALVELADDGIYELERSDSVKYIFCASGQVQAQMTESEHSGLVVLQIGQFLQIDPGASGTVAIPGGGSFYLLTDQTGCNNNGREDAYE